MPVSERSALIQDSVILAGKLPVSQLFASGATARAGIPKVFRKVNHFLFVNHLFRKIACPSLFTRAMLCSTVRGKVNRDRKVRSKAERAGAELSDETSNR